MYIPFDNNTGEKYEIRICQDDIATGDGVVLVLNKKACLAFSELFATLASESNNGHVHLGYDQDEPQGPGVRIEVFEDSSDQ